MMTTSADLAELRKVFLMLDVSKDGFLTKEELRGGMTDALGNLTADRTDWDEMVDQLDVNGDGKIDYSEFMTAAIDRRVLLNMENLEKAFKLFDADNNGKISMDELR